ncbi:hypothetical protein GCM10009098_07350 [Rheinheimera aquimaris]|uniref:Uncharacterized protein n=1 Tax=Rheinheimera aquimaris TaxID=412437 RepID=A0ABP3NDQ4_9GAMM|nr:hypothetical protein [Rheinheimera aquimaris]MCB5212091.1 hypothetical protein [Rheinheimera aquimaris]
MGRSFFSFLIRIDDSIFREVTLEGQPKVGDFLSIGESSHYLVSEVRNSQQQEGITELFVNPVTSIPTLFKVDPNISEVSVTRRSRR